MRGPLLCSARVYCNILLDNDNRQPICRLHFKPAKMYLSLFHGEHKGRVEIDSILDIYKYSEQLKQAVLNYLAEE